MSLRHGSKVFEAQRGRHSDKNGVIVQKLQNQSHKDRALETGQSSQGDCGAAGVLGCIKMGSTERLRRSRIATTIRQQKQCNRNIVVNKGGQSEKKQCGGTIYAAEDQRDGVGGQQSQGIVVMRITETKQRKRNDRLSQFQEKRYPVQRLCGVKMIKKLAELDLSSIRTPLSSIMSV